jgi:hypothetical protein
MSPTSSFTLAPAVLASSFTRDSYLSLRKKIHGGITVKRSLHKPDQSVLSPLITRNFSVGGCLQRPASLRLSSLSFSIGFSPSGAIFQTGGIDKPGSAIFLPEKLGGNILIMSYGHNSHLTNPNNSNLTKTGESYTDDDDPDYVYQSEDFSEDDSDFHPVNIADADLSEGYVTGLQFCHT